MARRVSLLAGRTIGGVFRSGSQDGVRAPAALGNASGGPIQAARFAKKLKALELGLEKYAEGVMDNWLNYCAPRTLHTYSYMR